MAAHLLANVTGREPTMFGQQRLAGAAVIGTSGERDNARNGTLVEGLPG